MYRMVINRSETGITSMTFTGGIKALNGGTAPNLYNSFADFLLGMARSSSISEDTPPLHNGLITAVNTNGHDFDQGHFRLVMRLSF